MASWVQGWRPPYQWVLRFFHPIRLKMSKVYCTCREEVRPDHLMHVMQNHLRELQIQPFSGNQRLELLTCLMEMSLVPACHAKPACLLILFKCPMCTLVSEIATETTRLAQPCEGAESIAPKWRLNVQTCFEHAMFSPILVHGFRATTAYTF